jgi:RecA-family ATPase
MTYSTQLDLFQSHLQDKADLVLYEKLTNAAARPSHKAWQKFLITLTTPYISETKDIPLIGPYKLNKNLLRKNENVESVSALVFDIDNPKGKSFDDIFRLTSHFSGVLHTTWSHTLDAPRYRLILTLTEPINAKDFQEVRNGFLFFNSELADIVDPACKDIARAYYLFSCPPERKDIAQCCVLLGKPVSPSSYNLPKHLSDNDSTLQIKTNTPLSNLIHGGIKQGGRNVSLASYVGGLINKGLDKEQTWAMAGEWNLSLEPPLDGHELQRTHDSIWNTHIRNNPDWRTKPNENTPKVFDYKLIPSGQLLATEPPKREYVINELIPKKIVATIIAAGGTGKSFLAMHIAVSAASGSSLFGKFLPSKPTKVVFISGEDDINELQRRLHKVMNGMSPNVKNTASNNLHFIDLADAFELFTSKTLRGEIQITEFPNYLCKLIKGELGEDIGLVIIDPISRFRGGEENLASDTTRFVQSLQLIRDRLNTSVLTLHHVNKGANVNGSSQNNARGSSAFIDGVRLVFEINTLSDKDVKQKYGELLDAPKLLTLQTVKTNYGRPIDPITLSRKEDGSLQIFSMVPGDHQKKAILQEIELAKLTKSQFRDTYGGVDKKFSLSQKALTTKLEEFERARLIVIPPREVMRLTVLSKTILED